MSREEVGCDLDERGGEAPWVLVHVLFEVTVEVLENEVDRPVAHHLVQQTGVELKCFKHILLRIKSWDKGKTKNEAT